MEERERESGRIGRVKKCNSDGVSESGEIIKNSFTSFFLFLFFW